MAERGRHLRFDAEMLTNFVLRDFHLPTLADTNVSAEPFDNLQGRGVQVGAQQGLRFEFARRIAHDHPAKWLAQQARLTSLPCFRLFHQWTKSRLGPQVF